MSNQLFEEDAPPTSTTKNGRSPRTPRAPEPVDTLSDPFAEEEPAVALAEPASAPEPEPAPTMPEPVVVPAPVVASVPPPAPAPTPAPVPLAAGPRVLPDERQSVTHTLKVGGSEGLLIVGLFEDGTPGEVLLLLRRAPSGVAEALEAVTETLNLALPYGVPVGPLANQLTRLIASPETKAAGQYIADYLISKFG